MSKKCVYHLISVSYTHLGVEVSASEALPGDIVYYGWHVGIYIGNGQMIHAPEEGDVVKISTVDWAAHTFVRCW